MARVHLERDEQLSGGGGGTCAESTLSERVLEISKMNGREINCRRAEKRKAMLDGQEEEEGESGREEHANGGREEGRRISCAAPVL